MVSRVRRRPGLVGRAVAFVFAAGVLGCSSSEQIASTDGAGAPSVDLASGNWMAAAAGPDLVIVSEPGETIEPVSGALRTPDGSISPLPPVPFRGKLGLSSVGDSVAVGGVECKNKACDDAVVAFALLSDDRSSWRRLDAPELALGAEVEIDAPSIGRHDHALFLIGPEQYSVAPSGQVSELPQYPFPSTEQGFSCVAGDTILAVRARGVPGSELGGMTAVVEFVGEVQALQLGAVDEGWTSIGPVPSGVRTPFSNLCLPDQFSFHDGTREAVLGVSSGTWTERPTNLTELLGNPAFLLGPSSVASSVDGSTNYLVTNGRVLSQDRLGTWTTTEHTATELYSTSDAVLAYDTSTKRFTEIGPS